MIRARSVLNISSFEKLWVELRVVVGSWLARRAANANGFRFAGGGTGQALAQLCKTVKNVTVIGTASKAKHEQLKDSCQHLLERETYSVSQVKKIAEDGVDLVLDCSCGDDVNKVKDDVNSTAYLVAFAS